MSEKAGELKLTPSGLGPIPRTSSPDLSPNMLNVPAKLIPSIISLAIAVQGCASLPTPNNPDQNTNIPPAGEVVPGLPTESVPTPMATESANYKQLDAIKQKVIELASGIKGMSILDSNVQNSLTEEQKKILEEFQKSQQEDINALFPAVSLDKTEVVSVSTNGQGTVEFGFSTLKFPNQEGNAITFQYKDAEGKIVNAALIQEADETDSHGRTVRRFIAIPSNGSAFPAIIAVYENPTDQSPKFAYVLQPAGEGFNVSPVIGGASPNTIKGLSGQYGQAENISYTITEPIEIVNIGEYQVPKDLLESSVADFANAFGINPEQVGELTPIIKTRSDNKQFVLLTTNNLFSTNDLDGSGFPLLIAEKTKNGEWSWQESNFKNSEFIIGTTVDGAEDFKNNDYQAAVRKFGIVFPAGSFLQSTIDQWGTEMVDVFSKNTKDNEQILYIHPAFWHQNVPKDVGEVETYMKNRVNYLLSIAEKNKGVAPVYINFYNEALKYNPSQPSNNWEESPYYDLFKQDVIKETYLMFYKQAQEKGLNIGTDIHLVYSDYDFYAPGKKSDIVFDNLMDTKSKIAEELGIPIEDVRIDLAMQLHLAHSPNYQTGYFKIPTDQEFLDNLVRFSQVGDIHITEFDILDGSLDEKQKLIRHFIMLSRSSGVVSDINLWYTLRKGEDNGIFNLDNYKNTQFYYLLLRDLHQ